MALISKMNRCAVCGSSEVVYNEAAGLYHCPVCGKDSAEPMPQADLTAVNRIAVLGDGRAPPPLSPPGPAHLEQGRPPAALITLLFPISFPY